MRVSDMNIRRDSYRNKDVRDYKQTKDYEHQNNEIPATGLNRTEEKYSRMNYTRESTGTVERDLLQHLPNRSSKKAVPVKDRSASKKKPFKFNRSFSRSISKPKNKGQMVDSGIQTSKLYTLHKPTTATVEVPRRLSKSTIPSSPNYMDQGTQMSRRFESRPRKAELRKFHIFNSGESKKNTSSPMDNFLYKRKQQ